MSDYSSTPANSGDSELQEFLMAEKQKAQVQAQVSVYTTPISTFISCVDAFDNKKKFVQRISHFISVFLLQIHEFNEICWERCIDTPSSKLDSKTETCLANCVDRFIDTSLLVTSRFAQLLQKSSE